MYSRNILWSYKVGTRYIPTLIFFRITMKGKFRMKWNGPSQMLGVFQFRLWNFLVHPSKFFMSKLNLLTHCIWQIQLWCPRSKWNMSEILAFLAFCTFDQKSVIKMTCWAHGGISKTFFLDHFSSSFLGQKC